MNECTKEIDRLNQDIKERWSAKTPPPQLTRVLVALKEVQKIVKQFLDRKPEVTAEPGPEPEEPEDVPQTDATAAGESAPVSVRRTGSRHRTSHNEAISNNEEARQQIIQAAHFLHKSDPADPSSYLVLRALGMGELYKNTESLESATFPSPSTPSVNACMDLKGVRKTMMGRNYLTSRSR